MSRTTITDGLNIKIDSYLGNGIDNKAIECGFQPDLVIIRPHTNQHSTFRTSAHTGDDTSYFANAAANFTGGIKSFFSKGFTIGTNATSNTAGVIYSYIAFKNSAVDCLTVGKYTGDGATTHAITGLNFTPDLVWIKRNAASASMFRDSLEVGDLTHNVGSAGYSTSAIKSIDTNGFTLGNNAAVNTNAEDFYYFALKNCQNFSVGTYDGDGSDDRSITGVGFSPNALIIKRGGTASGNGANSSVIRTNTMIGDLAGVFSNSALAANYIQSLITDGFTVGTNAVSNENAAPLAYHYYAFKSNRMRVTS